MTLREMRELERQHTVVTYTTTNTTQVSNDNINVTNKK